MVRETQKVIQSYKLIISHQMMPYSDAKTIWGSSFTYFGVFGTLMQLRETGTKGSKYCKSMLGRHRKSSKVFKSSFHIKWSLTQVWWVYRSSLTCFRVFEAIGQFGGTRSQFPDFFRILHHLNICSLKFTFHNGVNDWFWSTDSSRDITK